MSMSHKLKLVSTEFLFLLVDRRFVGGWFWRHSICEAAMKEKKKLKRKKKDPLRPKRAMSSFMFFANAKRQEVRSANPELKITDVGKKLGEMWKELSDDEKKVRSYIPLFLTHDVAI